MNDTYGVRGEPAEQRDLDPADDGSEPADAPETGELDLEERSALRRVAGLSTELVDVSEVEYRRLRLERVVLAGVWADGSAQGARNALTELKLLAETAGSQVLDAVLQHRRHPDPATYIGRGKVAELREVVEATGADTVICDGELSPGQLRNLEDRIKTKVIDRTALILDIFAQHAKSREGKAQVELAQLQYMNQRLRGWGGNLSRQAGGRVGSQGGGIGGRGPGETKLETDRRRVQQRMAKLRRELAQMRTTRDTKRLGRQRGEVPSVAIAGYTNAGKSSLLNRLTDAGVLVEDALFATLDPTTRRTATADGRGYTLTDTVGFVRQLPHDLVDAFRSTLEEVTDSDVVVHVVDGADPDPLAQIDAVREVFRQIGASDVAEIVAINKVDVADPVIVAAVRRREPGAVVVSASTGAGLDELRSVIEAELPRPAHEVRALVPYDRGDLVAQTHARGDVLTEEHTAAGTRLHARVPGDLAGQLEAFAAAPAP